MAGDSWASSVARGFWAETGKTESDVALFFISYILIASVMMLNVVVAVLLDEFISTVTREKEAEERLRQHEVQKRKVTGCLDPLTRTLVTFQDEEDLASKIDLLYDKLDEVSFISVGPCGGGRGGGSPARNRVAPGVWRIAPPPGVRLSAVVARA